MKAFTIALAVSVALLGAVAPVSDALAPVKGGVTKYSGAADEIPPIYGKAYYPKDKRVQRIDAIADKWALEAAEQRYKKVLEKDPKNAAALNGLGKVYYWMTATSNQEIRDHKAEYYAKATQYFLRALAYQPGYVEARLNLGTVYLEQNRLRDAEEEFIRAARLDPNNSEANEKMGVVMLKQSQYNDAVPWLKRATKLDSSNSSAYYHLGVALTARGEYWDALRALNTSLGLFGNSAPTHYQMGVVYEQQGNGAAAVAEYKKALAISPEYQSASLSLASHYTGRGDDSFALETLKNASEADRTNTGILMQIADLSMRNHQPDVAQRYYMQTLIHDPDNKRAQKGVAESELAMAQDYMKNDRLPSGDARMMGEWKAQHAVEQALTYDPSNLDAKLYQVSFQPRYSEPLDFSRQEIAATLNNPDFSPHQSFKKGEVLLDRYRFAQADALFDVAINNSKNVKDSVTLGETFLSMGLPDMAEKAFRHVLVHQNHSIAQSGIAKAAEARTQSGMIATDAKYHGGGFSENHRNFHASDREQMLKHALQLNVKNADAHYTLAQLYEDTDRYGEAADHYFAYLQLNPAAPNRKSIEKRIAKLQEKMWVSTDR